MYTAKNAYVWENLAAGRPVEVFPVATEPVTAEFVQFKDREKDHYGDYLQDDREMFVIFKVGDRYFKKYGDKSSYGDEAWDGECVEVFPTTKTIQVFE